MEKYVIPPFYYSDFKFPSVNKALLKEVKLKLIFAELAASAISLRSRYRETALAGLLRVRPCSSFFTVSCRRAVSSNGNWRGVSVTFFAVQQAALSAKKNREQP